jgi:hypothetical protein
MMVRRWKASPDFGGGKARYHPQAESAAQAGKRDDRAESNVPAAVATHSTTFDLRR